MLKFNRTACRYLLAAATTALVSFTAFQAGASHFRYATMSWTRSQANPLQVTFAVTEAWRSTFTDSLFFTNGAGGSFNTTTNRNTIGTFTDAAGEQYTVFNTSITQTYPSASVFNLAAGSCCRIGSLQNGNADDSFNIRATLDLTQPIGNDTGSPVAQAPIIVPLPQTTAGTNATFQLPFADPDGDNVTVSVSPAGNAGSGLTTALPNAGGNTLSVSPTGLLSWDTSGTALGNKYAIQVQVKENDSQATIPVDFIIEISNTTGNQAPTVNGQSLTLQVGDVLNTTVTGNDPDNGPTTPLTWNLDAITGPQTVLNATFDPLSQLLMWNTTGFALGVYTFFISNFDGAANGLGQIVVNLQQAGPGAPPVAEPGTLAVLLLGLGGLVLLRRRRVAI